MNQKRTDEAEWKDAFEKMPPVEQAFLFGLYTGRLAEQGGLDEQVSWPESDDLAEAVWRLRLRVEGTP